MVQHAFSTLRTDKKNKSNSKSPITTLHIVNRLKWDHLLVWSTFLITIFARAELFMSSTFLIFKLRFIHCNKIRTDTTDHVLCEQSDGLLASSWTITYDLNYYELVKYLLSLPYFHWLSKANNEFWVPTPNPGVYSKYVVIQNTK